MPPRRLAMVYRPPLGVGSNHDSKSHRHGNDNGRTVDVGTTFTVNHLAHYLLVRRLLPVLADRAVVVLTTSGTIPRPVPGCSRRGTQPRICWHIPIAIPDDDARPRKAGEHAYAASKPCAVLTARSLSQHPDAQARGLTAIANDPAQVQADKWGTQ